jgi:hypothetical protein
LEEREEGHFANNPFMFANNSCPKKNNKIVGRFWQNKCLGSLQASLPATTESVESAARDFPLLPAKKNASFGTPGKWPRVSWQAHNKAMTNSHRPQHHRSRPN